MMHICNYGSSYIFYQFLLVSFNICVLCYLVYLKVFALLSITKINKILKNIFFVLTLVWHIKGLLAPLKKEITPFILKQLFSTMFMNNLWKPDVLMLNHYHNLIHVLVIIMATYDRAPMYVIVIVITPWLHTNVK